MTTIPDRGLGRVFILAALGLFHGQAGFRGHEILGGMPQHADLVVVQHAFGKSPCVLVHQGVAILRIRWIQLRQIVDVAYERGMHDVDNRGVELTLVQHLLMAPDEDHLDAISEVGEVLCELGGCYRRVESCKLMVNNGRELGLGVADGHVRGDVPICDARRGGQPLAMLACVVLVALLDGLPPLLVGRALVCIEVHPATGLEERHFKPQLSSHERVLRQELVEAQVAKAVGNDARGGHLEKLPEQPQTWVKVEVLQAEVFRHWNRGSCLGARLAPLLQPRFGLVVVADQCGPAIAQECVYLLPGRRQAILWQQFRPLHVCAR
mmetsp:Transcript_119716/g.310439  ORF Transcript_119716/g.310439 Transcript_119716/m.310439 type:complete len:323 (+) Transcript_119716:473-1441(+)